MKFFFLTLFSFILLTGFSQDRKLTLSANNKSLHVSVDSTNDQTVFVIDDRKFSENDFLTIRLDTAFANDEWKQNFFIYDSSNNAIKDFVLMHDKTYCVKLTELKRLLTLREEYFIYMTSVPKDPAKAIMVKIAKVLVCKIKIR